MDEEEKKFKEQYKKNKLYEYQSGDFMIIVPATANDMQDEAEQQKICVNSYIDKVRNGETVIAFLRRKEDPKKSYATMEILNGSIWQLKLKSNKNVEDPDTLRFLQKYAAEKQLRIDVPNLFYVVD